MFTAAPCTETVSIPYALIFGAGEACVNVSMWSLLWLLIPFAVAVMGLQWVANRLVHGAPTPGAEPGAPPRLKTGQRLARHLRRPDHSAASATPPAPAPRRSLRTSSSSD